MIFRLASGAKAKPRPIGLVLVVGAVREHVRPHRVPRDPGDVSAATLERLLVGARDHADIVPLADLVAAIAEGERARPAIVVWFEGHGRSIADVAAPLMRRLDAPFTVTVSPSVPDERAIAWPLLLETIVETRDAVSFDHDGLKEVLALHSPEREREGARRLLAVAEGLAPAARARFVADLATRAGIDVRRFHRDRLLAWSDVTALADDPLVTLAAGGLDLVPLAGLEPAEARRQLRDGGKTLSAAMGRPIDAIAYPEGTRENAGPRDFALAAELGYAVGLTRRPGVVFADHASAPTALPSMTLVEGDTTLAKLRGWLAGKGAGPGFARPDVGP